MNPSNRVQVRTTPHRTLKYPTSRLGIHTKFESTALHPTHLDNARGTERGSDGSGVEKGGRREVKDTEKEKLTQKALRSNSDGN